MVVELCRVEDGTTRKVGMVGWLVTRSGSSRAQLVYMKGAAIVSHKLVLAQQEIAELRAANKAATRRKSHKRKRIKVEGSLAVKDSQRLTALKEFGARSDGKKVKKRVRAEVGEQSRRRCGWCNETGHNAQTCKEEAEVVSE
jgi:hypothetical protein